MKMKISRKFDFENQKSNFNVFLMKHILTDPGHTKPCSNCSTNMNSFRSRDHPVRLTLLPSAFRNEETETRPIEMTYSYQIPRRLRSWGLYPQAGPGRHGFSASSEPLFPRRRPCSFRHTGANSLLGPPRTVWCPLVFPSPSLGLPSGLQCCDLAGLPSPVAERVLPALVCVHWTLPCSPGYPPGERGPPLRGLQIPASERHRLRETFKITDGENPPLDCLAKQPALFCLIFVGSTTPWYFSWLYVYLLWFYFPPTKNESFLRTGTLSHSLKQSKQRGLPTVWRHTMHGNDKICLAHLGELEGICYIYKELNKKLYLLYNYKTNRIQILGITN